MLLSLNWDKFLTCTEGLDIFSLINNMQTRPGIQRNDFRTLLCLSS